LYAKKKKISFLPAILVVVAHILSKHKRKEQQSQVVQIAQDSQTKTMCSIER
jgi:hypothetical protein